MGRTRTRYSEPEIVRILRDREDNDLSVRAICVKYGITSSTFYRWRNRQTGMTQAVIDAWDADIVARPRVPSVSGAR